LDKYMMGLLDGSAVPVSEVYSESLPPPGFICDQPISNVTTAVSIAAIQAAVGVRTPGPQSAQRDFALGFIAETKNRLLNSTEMTFYETLASSFTRPIAAGEPDPYLEQNWVSVGRFFGQGVRWSSAIGFAVRAGGLKIEPSAGNSVMISAVGFPGENYQLETSPDLALWTPGIGSQADPANGSLSFNDSATEPQRFYRIVYQQ
jgi:hypothetical protein